MSYYPFDTKLKMNIEKWTNQSRKTCYLDDIMKIEKKKIGPGHYAAGTHKQWSDHLSSTMQHGHAQKGKFGRHDRVLYLQELMD